MVFYQIRKASELYLEAIKAIRFVGDTPSQVNAPSNLVRIILETETMTSCKDIGHRNLVFSATLKRIRGSGDNQTIRYLKQPTATTNTINDFKRITPTTNN